METKVGNGEELIKELERKRESKIIVYFTGDRQPIPSRIAEDSVRPLYDHLLDLKFVGDKKVIDLFLFSRGGDVSVPWRLVSMIREFCDEFNVLIPYKAQSAATLLSLGADRIFMGKKAELGPIDPTLVKSMVGEGASPQQEIAVEDVNSFLSFIREKANINDQEALAKLVDSLVKEVSPLTLGNINRQHSHIRLVARKLLTSRKEKMDEEKLNSIIETLTQKIYSHGHGIGRKEARDIGLPISFPEDDLEKMLWRLYLIYENYLELNNPILPELELEGKERILLEDKPIAIIESVDWSHVYKINIELKVNRNIPPSPQLNVNFSFQLPPNILPAQLPQEVQQVLQKIMEKVTSDINKLVYQEIKRQSPIVGISWRLFGGKWHQERMGEN